MKVQILIILICLLWYFPCELTIYQAYHWNKNQTKITSVDVVVIKKSNSSTLFTGKYIF